MGARCNVAGPGGAQLSDRKTSRQMRADQAASRRIPRSPFFFTVTLRGMAVPGLATRVPHRSG